MVRVMSLFEDLNCCFTPFLPYTAQACSNLCACMYVCMYVCEYVRVCACMFSLREEGASVCWVPKVRGIEFSRGLSWRMRLSVMRACDAMRVMRACGGLCASLSGLHLLHSPTFPL